MRSQTSRKRARNNTDSSVKENGVLAAKVAVAEKRVKSCLSRSRSPSLSHHEHNHRRYSPTGRSSPTATVNGAESVASHNGPTLVHKAASNGLLVDRQPAVPPLPAVNGFPVTRDAPAPARPSRVADNGHSPNATMQQRKASHAKGQNLTPHHHQKATQLKSSSQATSNQRSSQHHNNNNKVQHSTKQQQQRNSHAPTAAEDMVVVSALRRQQMKDAFQPWVMQTYGDAAKTKTIARRKAERIVKILRGEDRSNGADSSKFRFWVRAKGFRLGPPPPSTPQTVSDKSSSSSSSSCVKDRSNSTSSHVQPTNEAEELFVVTSTAKDDLGDDRPVYKKVAVVEDFFDIIYREHVEFGGRATGKHAGQKRTYRAITEIYAFLPREAVTRFLMQCAECQRRGSSGNGSGPVLSVEPSATALLCAPSPPSTLSPLTDCGVSPGSPTPPASPTWKPGSTSLHPAVPWCGAAVRDAWCSLSATLSPPSPSASQSQSASNGAGTLLATRPALVGASPNWPPGSSPAPPLALPLDSIDLSLPLTTTLLKHARLAGVPHQTLFGLDRAEACFATGAESDDNRSSGRGSPQGMTAASKSSDGQASMVKSTTSPEISSSEGSGSVAVGIDIGLGANPPASVMATAATAGLLATASAVSQGVAPPVPVVPPPSTVSLLSTDPASPITLDLSSKSEVMEDHSPGLRDDDDDDDDDEAEAEDKMDNQVYDPERLKAFNMFVRLFVDENLDRKTPISRQPREKVQAIIDSCLRQFPEFGERARKRIRTYLKSCRRNKRSHREAGLDAQNRPMPPHLTSAAAEQILAQACENENQNAKRLRMGLEPISQPLPVAMERPISENSLPARSSSPSSLQSTPLPMGGEPLPTSSVASSTTSASLTTTANLFRPAFGPYQRSTGPAATCATAFINNSGATDLSTKSRPPAVQPTSNGLSTHSNSAPVINSRTSPLPHKLNTAEILAVRQLVTGYRESAAFLLRSADELEQLLLQQHGAS